MYLRTAMLFLFVLAVIRNIINKWDLLDEIAGSGSDDTEYLLHELHGIVGKENFTYFSLYEEGPIKIVLRTYNGDADLYVSSNKKPQYHPELYDYASTTCGVDVVDIPEDMKTPIIIGVYGHPSYEKSIFILSTYVNTRESNNTKRGNKKELSFKEKLNFIIRTTAMWKTFELVEGIFYEL